MNKISVIMLVYNREELVGRMIECILAQTMKEFEFIIVDNGSTDRSGIIAEQYSKKDSRIRVIHSPKGNIGSGRNTGLDASTGDYIAYVDDDDYCENDYLQFLYQLMVENHADVSICGATWSNIDEKRVMNSEEALIKLLQRKNYNVAFPTKMFKRELFQNNRFLETGKYDDIYLMPKILSEADTVAYHGISKYHFNRHANNNSGWTQNHKLLTAETLQEYLDVYSTRTKWLSEKYPARTDQWNYFNWSFMLSMTEKVTRLELKDCYPIKTLMVEELSAHRRELKACGYLQEFEKKWLEELL